MGNLKKKTNCEQGFRPLPVGDPLPGKVFPEMVAIPVAKCRCNWEVLTPSTPGFYRLKCPSCQTMLRIEVEK